jgi:hypothetical protein
MGHTLKHEANACCDFPCMLQVAGLSSLSVCATCTSGSGTVWGGLLRDYSNANRCIYKVDEYTDSQITGSIGLDQNRTKLVRSVTHQCVWILYISCDHCSSKKWVWVGHSPDRLPQGRYRMVWGCNPSITSLTVTRHYPVPQTVEYIEKCGKYSL